MIRQMFNQKQLKRILLADWAFDSTDFVPALSPSPLCRVKTQWRRQPESVTDIPTQLTSTNGIIPYSTRLPIDELLEAIRESEKNDGEHEPTEYIECPRESEDVEDVR